MNGREEMLGVYGRDLVDQYDEMLDDVYGTVKVAGMVLETSRVLSECDPVAYRCGMHDYLDSIGYEEE